jgi:hypothetical protein
MFLQLRFPNNLRSEKCTHYPIAGDIPTLRGLL